MYKFKMYGKKCKTTKSFAKAIKQKQQAWKAYTKLNAKHKDCKRAERRWTDYELALINCQEFGADCVKGGYL